MAISKSAFVKIMNSLRDYWDELDKDMERFGVVYEDNHLTRVFDGILDALCDDLEPEFNESDRYDPWCYYFAFELDWGRRDMAKNCVKIDGVEYSLQTPEQLYDLLMKERDKCA
jgi:hypothetical protein